MIRDFYARNGVTDGLLLGQPATEQSIAEFEQTLGLKVSEEFRSLYRQYDGISATPDENPELYFGFVPIQRLPGFIQDVQRSFRAEHPLESRQFFPFFDWGDRTDFNVLGFMYSDKIGLDPELFLFWRGGDSGKTVFLMPTEVSIESFLLGDESESESGPGD